MHDSVKIYDGDNTGAPVLGSRNGYCGSRRPPILMSIGRAILVVFVSDNSLTYSGFRISYRFTGICKYIYIYIFIISIL